MTVPRGTSAAPVRNWRSVRYAAKFFNRTERLIRYWCVRGRFSSMDVPIFKDAKNRWWIQLQDEESTKLGL